MSLTDLSNNNNTRSGKDLGICQQQLANATLSNYNAPTGNGIHVISCHWLITGCVTCLLKLPLAGLLNYDHDHDHGHDHDYYNDDNHDLPHQ